MANVSRSAKSRRVTARLVARRPANKRSTSPAIDELGDSQNGSQSGHINSVLSEAWRVSQRGSRASRSWLRPSGQTALDGQLNGALNRHVHGVMVSADPAVARESLVLSFAEGSEI